MAVRLLRSADFRNVYDNGVRISSPYFAAFCLAATGQERPKIGFTVSRAAGNSVLRNRLRRRLREAVRLSLSRLGPKWVIVFNPRRKTLDAPFEDLLAEVRKLFLRCESL
jgi:ribonuclease P protein component